MFLTMGWRSKLRCVPIISVQEEFTRKVNCLAGYLGENIGLLGDSRIAVG